MATLSDIKTPNININSSIAGYNAGGGAIYKSGNSPSNIDSTGIITPEKLTPANPINLPIPTPLTNASSSQEAIGVTTATNKTQADAEANKKLETLKASKDTSLQDYLNNIIALGNEPAKQSEMLTALGGDQAKIDASNYGSQIEAEQLANRRAIETLTKNNPEGLYGGALTSKINDINNASLSKQADLAILQNSALKKYDVANDIATRKIQAETEGLKASLEARKTIYEDNKDSFTKEEQRQIEAKIRAEDRTYNETVKEKEYIKSILLEAAKTGIATPQDIAKISNAKNSTEAIIAGARFLTDPIDRQIKLANLSKTLAETSKINAEKEQAGKVYDVLNNLDPTSQDYTSKMIDASKGGKVLTSDQIAPITKGLTVVGQIGNLKQTLTGQDTGPLLGIIRGNNPYDVKAKLIQAQLQALVPNLARGVYGEVGVLTDQDIANYSKTLGNIKTPQETNDLLLAMTLKTIKNSLDNQFQVLSASGRNVSGFKGIYSRLQGQIQELNGKLGVSEVSNTTNSYLDSALPTTDGTTQSVNSGVNDWLTKNYGTK